MQNALLGHPNPEAPMTRPCLSHFNFNHLPPDLADVSLPFNRLAHFVAVLPENPESDMALRKLLEAKDCAVRAAILGRGALDHG
jgi:hypothetical protein